MPLVIEVQDYRFSPTVCDHCGLPIMNALEGNYQWRMGLRDTDFGNRLYFTHKGCCLAFQQSHPVNGFWWAAMPLQCLPIDLGNNLKLRWQEARRLARSFGPLR